MEIEKAVRKPALGMEKIKKLRVAGRSREGNRENEPVRLKLLIGVAAPGDGAEIAEICNANAAALSYAFEGWGTARSAMRRSSSQSPSLRCCANAFAAFAVRSAAA